MSLSVPEDKIRVIIWKGWENVQRMEKEYWVNVSIAEDWMTTITAENQEWWQKAIADIKAILWEPEVWNKLEWKVVKIIDGVWAIVEFKWKSGMIHISKLAKERVSKVDDIVKVWDNVKIEVIQVDKIKGRIWLRKI
jgi:polyribonucleotide nucleotidyltransferase